MQRRAAKLVAAALVLAIAAFAGTYLVFFNDDSPDEFTLNTADERADATGDINGTWTVASGSEAGYRVREKLANLPAQSDAVGRTPDVTGSAVIADSSVTAASFEVDVTTLKSDEGRRDNRIRTSGLESDKYPEATFTLTEPIPIDADTDAASVNFEAKGDLTLHGVTKEVTIPIEATRNGDRLELVGSITFPFSDFAIDPPSIAGFVTVEDDATMEFHIFLEQGN